jgi:hypothetical protein
MKIAIQAVLSSALLLGGCGGLENLGKVLGDVLGTSGSGEIVAEVQGVDTRRQVVDVITQDGQRGGVAYDQRTRVVYRDQDYPVTALERGDIVALRVQDTGQGLYTDYILVQQSVRERTGQTGALQTVQGRVGQVDHARGMFQLTDDRGVTIVVAMPFNPRQTDRNRFNALRGGEYVRVTGRWITQERFELERFE